MPESRVVPLTCWAKVLSRRSELAYVPVGTLVELDFRPSSHPFLRALLRDRAIELVEAPTGADLVAGARRFLQETGR